MAAAFPVTCVYAAADGSSHLIELKLPAIERTMGAEGRAVLTGLHGARDWGVVLSDGSTYGDWHVSSQVGLSIVLSGAWEIETTSGQRQRLNTGGVLLMFDTTGRGHRSRLVDDQPCSVMGLGLDAATQDRFQALLSAALEQRTVAADKL